MQNNSITVRVPGTCGELVQGRLNGENFLVTCPIKIFSYVTVRNAVKGLEKKLPQDKWKAREALKKILQYFGLR